MTKVKGEMTEMTVALEGLALGWQVLKPLVDNCKYDLVFELKGKFIRVQAKTAWFDKNSKRFIVDARKTKTNRRVMKRVAYTPKDFDFAIVFIQELKLFYVFPSSVFTSYGSNIVFDPEEKGQRVLKSSKYKNAWHLLK
jgi:hypothetical protein